MSFLYGLTPCFIMEDIYLSLLHNLEEIEFCINTVYHKFKEKYHLIQNKKTLLKVPYQDIYYCLSAKHYVDIISKEQTLH